MCKIYNQFMNLLPVNVEYEIYEKGIIHTSEESNITYIKEKK